MTRSLSPSTGSAPPRPSWISSTAAAIRRWVRAARERGLRAADGLAMLVEQGALAFERWFDIAPDRNAMWEALRNEV